MTLAKVPFKKLKVMKKRVFSQSKKLFAQVAIEGIQELAGGWAT